MNATTRNILKFTAFLGAGLIVLYLVYLNFDQSWQEQCALDGIPSEDCSLIRKVAEDFRTVNYFWIFLVFLAFILSNISRTLKWKMLLKPLGYEPKTTNAFLSIMLGYFANLGLPRMGEVVRCGALAKYEKIPLEKVMGTVFMDRATDMVMMIIAVLITFVMQYELLTNFLRENAQFDSGLQLILLLLGILIVAAALAYFAFVLLKKFRPNFADWIMQMAYGFLEGIKGIKKLEKPAWFIFHTAMIWVLYFSMSWLAFYSFAPTEHLGLAAALMVFTLGTLGMLIPTPGGMGSFHYLAVIALALYGVHEADGFSFANILFFSVQLGCNVTLGILALILLPVLNRSRK